MTNMLQVYPAPAGSHGFDTSARLTAATAKALRKAGFRFAIRYLSRVANPPDGDLTSAEVNIIFDAGLSLMAVQHVAKKGWKPSEQLGAEYGRNAVAHAQSIELPGGTSVWLDLEGIDGEVEAEEVVAYCNAWFPEVEKAGYTTGIYVGSNCRLSGDQLYYNLKTKHYWKSGSDVPEIPLRGYCMVQHIKKHDSVGGVGICRDVTLVDAFGEAPMLASREAAGLVAAPVSLMSREVVLDDIGGVDDRASEEAVLRSLATRYDLVEPMNALLEFRKQRGAPRSARFWGVADFDLRSSEPRLFLFDVQEQHVQPYLCAHGKGSEGPTDDGYASVFSNREGSNCTSLGIYACAESYDGKHGFSMRLDGLQSTNSNARERAVVLHGANYVSPDFIKRHGRIGRSDGCLAVENRYVTEIVDALHNGSLIIAWHKGSSRLTAGYVNEDHERVWSELEPLDAVAAETSVESTFGNSAAIARRILESKRITLARAHASGIDDDATAYQNIVDTAAGKAANRSSYGNAPGGAVALDQAMLQGVLTLSETYSVSISEFCGGSHNPNSRHYAGCTADFNTINGRHVSSSHPDVVAFQRRCKDLGATEVLGPGQPGHATHVHAGWPRPL